MAVAHGTMATWLNVVPQTSLSLSLSYIDDFTYNKICQVCVSDVTLLVFFFFICKTNKHWMN